MGHLTNNAATISKAEGESCAPAPTLEFDHHSAYTSNHRDEVLAEVSGRCEVTIVVTDRRHQPAAETG